MSATLHGSIVDLHLTNPQAATERARTRRSIDDFVLDHDHLMHIYAVRVPALDVIYHLHPTRITPGNWQLPLPSMPPGTYRLYADIVHTNGFPETMVASLTVPPSLPGRQLTGDDAMGTAAPAPTVHPDQNEAILPDGYRVHFDRPPTLQANTGYELSFHLLTPSGAPVPDPALYMGMPGHAAILKQDGTVFAHIHPSGSASMAAMQMADTSTQSGSSTAMPMEMGPPAPNVSFLYGFPTPGPYRIFVQMKHGSTVETAPFDVQVH